MPVMNETPVVIMGLMGAGKSTVARLVAEALGREMRDSDGDLEARYGQTAARMNETVGADVLHDRETEVLLDAVAARPAVVVAAAASTVEDPAARDALTSSFVVFLDGPPEVLAERMLSSSHRPHFEPDLVHMLKTQRDKRRPKFLEVADHVADATRTPHEITTAVLAAFR
ncbi:shikimate kinase [Herbidospora galbida]|uniref:Shikimate kinase n=2 Tax=Herbidospora galbida TaxID=2575442 RepID=A0A4U3MK14_9ACTN|nr:shikimate kinase [Herbidospora galbida]